MYVVCKKQGGGEVLRKWSQVEMIGSNYFGWVVNSGTGGVGIMVAEKWVEKVLEVRRVNARVIVRKLLFDKHILTVVSTYASQIGLSGEEEDDFWDRLVHVVSGIREREKLL